MKFGGSRTEQNTGGYEAWSGLVGGPGFNPSYTEIFPDGMFTLNNTSGLLDQFAGGGSDLQPNYYYSFDFGLFFPVVFAIRSVNRSWKSGPTYDTA